MKNNKVARKSDKKHSFGAIAFWLLTAFHYLFGIAGLVSATLVATNTYSQKMSGLVSLFCIAAFAITQPDIKYRRLFTGWRFPDKKLTNEESY